MTNDLLHASIAAALVQADLAFTTVVGSSGDRNIRLFEVEFGLLQSKRTCLVTAYVVGPVLVALAPVSVRATRRQDIGDALVNRFPMVRMFLDQREQPADLVTAWVESSVPVPVNVLQPTSPLLAIPPWLSVPPIMNVPAGVDFIMSTYAGDAFMPTERISPPMFAAEPNTFGGVSGTMNPIR
jgi:hypothetical protein